MIMIRGSNKHRYNSIKIKKENSLTQMKISDDYFQKDIQIHCNLNLGDAILFSLHCAHKIGINKTKIPKVSMIARFRTIDSIYNSGWE